MTASETEIGRKLESIKSTGRTTSATKDLDELYENVLRLNSNYPEDQSDVDGMEEALYKQQLILAALKLSFIAFEPLSMKALAEAASLNANAEMERLVGETHLSALCSNMVMANTDGEVQFVHQSVRDWLQRRKSIEGEPNASFTEKAHIQTTLSSLSCMRYHWKTDGRFHYAISRYRLTLEDSNCDCGTDACTTEGQVLFHASFQHYAHFQWLRHYSCLSVEKRKQYLWESIKDFMFDDSGESEILREWAERDFDAFATDRFPYVLVWTLNFPLPKDSQIVALFLATCFNLPDILQYLEHHFGCQFDVQLPLARIVYFSTNIVIPLVVPETALHLAAHFDSYEVIKFLTESPQGNRIFRGCSNGNTPYHIAVEKGKLETIQLFQNRFTKLELRMGNENGETALHRVARLWWRDDGQSPQYDERKFNAIIGFDPIILGLQDNDGNTVLHTIFSRPSPPELVEQLLSVADPKWLGLQTKFNENLLHKLAKRDYDSPELQPTTYNSLLSKIPRDHMTARGPFPYFTPLHLATSRNIAMIPHLVACMEKTEISLRDYMGNTALHLYADTREKDPPFLITDRLLKRQIPLPEGETTLVAAMNKSDLGLVNEHGLTCLHLASELGGKHLPIIHLSSPQKMTEFIPFTIYFLMLATQC